MTDLNCATWNIHRAVGADGQRDASRVMTAVETATGFGNLDVLALQEADTECPPHASIIDVARISHATGLTYQHDHETLRWGPQSDGFLGTILWVHPRFVRSHADVIDLPGHCHRGAISTEFTNGDMPFRIMSGHFSLMQVLRAAQMRILGQYLRRRPRMQTILLGDLNEWRPWGGFALSKQMLGGPFTGPALCTFPTKRPVLPLDRILCDQPGAVRDAQVIDTPATNLASDHRPLVATVKLTNVSGRETIS